MMNGELRNVELRMQNVELLLHCDIHHSAFYILN